MNIAALSGIRPILTVKLNSINYIKSQSLSRDVFVKSAAETKENSFNAENAVNELRGLETFNGKPKFTEDKLEVLKDILKANPQKWNAVKTISSQPKMISSLVLDFASRDVVTLDAVSELSLMTKENGSPRFSPLEIRNLANKLDGKGLKVAGKLSDTPLGSDNIIEIAKDKDIKNVDKLREKVLKFSESVKEDYRRVSFVKDDFDENAYNIRIDIPDKGSKILLLDKNLDDAAIELVSIEKADNGRVFQVKKSNDFRNNTISEIKAEVSPRMPQPVVSDETRIIKDRNGNIVRKEIYSLSEVAGTPNIKYIYPDGSEKIVSCGYVDEKNGITTVKKDMKSLDGTRTQYLFEDDRSGNMISDYKITDKNGNVIFNHSMTFEVVSENKFISTENDKKYEITVDNGKINVKNMQNNEVTALKLDDLTDGNREKLMTSLKRMPAEELIGLAQNTNKLTGIENTFESAYSAKTKTIASGDNLFTILHEAGHAKDYAKVDVKQKETLMNSIYSNPEVNKIFEQEKAAFNKAFPLSQREHISYFIKLSEYKDGLQETIAETNALINTKNTEDLFSVRSHYLQQYFPRTIAMLATIID